jgi:hypothetical protein
MVLEKILKAIFVDKNDNNLPPKIHHLVRLSELSKIKLKGQLNNQNGSFKLQNRPKIRPLYCNLSILAWPNPIMTGVKDTYLEAGGNFFWQLNSNLTLNLRFAL